jgi:hypothetical protein
VRAITRVTVRRGRVARSPRRVAGRVAERTLRPRAACTHPLDRAASRDMTGADGFVLASDWYWRLFEGAPTFGHAEAALAARDFVYPLAHLVRDRVAVDGIAVDADGDGLRFAIAGRPIALACRGLRVDELIAAINRGLADAELDLELAIVPARRYELRGVLRARATPPRRLATGTLPP